MADMLAGIIFTWLILGAVAACIRGMCHNEGAHKSGYAVAVIALALCILMTYLIPNISYNSDRAVFVHNNMLVQMYEEQLPSFEKDIERFSMLNPKAAFLSNQDTPIATTMKLRADMIKSLTRAKEKAYKARVGMSEIENSIFSYAANPLKEEGGLE